MCYNLKKLCLLALALLVLTFAGITPASAAVEDKFSDLLFHSAKQEIGYLYEKDIINGYSDGTFRPNNTVTRVQAISMIARALKLDLSNRPNPGFKDIPTSHYAYREIAAVVDEGYYPKGDKLYPHEPMSRESMARIISNAFNLKGESHKTFTDVPKSYWAYQYISKLAANNITTGYSDNTFKPKNRLTRAHFSLFLARALNDDYKTYTYTDSKIHFSIQLPNYLKEKLIIEQGTYSEFGGPSSYTDFYIYDNTILQDKVFVASLTRYTHYQWDNYFFAGPEMDVLRTKNWVYALNTPGESPYAHLPHLEDHPVVQEYFDIFDRVSSSLEQLVVSP